MTKAALSNFKTFPHATAASLLFKGTSASTGCACAWKLPPERYLVKVVVTSSGQKCVVVLRLINDVASRTDFRLLPVSPGDPKVSEEGLLSLSL